MSFTGKASTLLPNIIKENSRKDPDGVFAHVPSGTNPNYTEGYRPVTKLQFHNAVNFTASLIKERFGEAKEFETLTYVGPGDIRYSVLVVAGMKAGYKVFLPSPRNSTEAHVSLMTRLRCTKLVITEPAAPCVPSILREVPLQTLSLPPPAHLLEVQNVAEYPYDKTFNQAKSDPAFVLHTSGSTGEI
jgi:acyl-coenzyme A synthetase/AMP-(fatty) acid ligase